MCPGKRNFCFFSVTFAKVLPLAVIFRCFCGYFCNFPTFSENFVSAWQTKSAWLPAPRIHLFPALSLFSKYAPIVLQTPPLIVLLFQVLLSTPVWPTWPDLCSLTRDDNYSRTFHVNDKGRRKGYILMIFLVRCHENNWLVIPRIMCQRNDNCCEIQFPVLGSWNFSKQ